MHNYCTCNTGWRRGWCYTLLSIYKKPVKLILMNVTYQWQHTENKCTNVKRDLTIIFYTGAQRVPHSSTRHHFLCCRCWRQKALKILTSGINYWQKMVWGHPRSLGSLYRDPRDPKGVPRDQNFFFIFFSHTKKIRSYFMIFFNLLSKKSEKVIKMVKSHQFRGLGPK